jgi:hypothetical protein
MSLRFFSLFKFFDGLATLSLRASNQVRGVVICKLKQIASSPFDQLKVPRNDNINQLSRSDRGLF